MGKRGSSSLKPASMKLFRGPWKDVAKAFLADGHMIYQRPNGHLRWEAPDGPVFSSASVSDHRAIHKHLKQLREAGWVPSNV